MLRAFALALGQLTDPAVLRVLGKSLLATLVIFVVAGSGLWWLAERGLALAGLTEARLGEAGLGETGLVEAGHRVTATAKSYLSEVEETEARTALVQTTEIRAEYARRLPPEPGGAGALQVVDLAPKVAVVDGGRP